MRTSTYILIAVLVVALALASVTALAQANYTAGELDELLGPIALYPDPLLAQIFPAATFLDQLGAASRYGGATSGIDTQPWDVSVKAVAHYPDVLDMMVKNRDWTIAIGQAYVNQPTDVMQSVQRLRAKADAMGNLASSAQQQVLEDSGTIAVVPAQPQYVYVPQYNPQVVYTEQAPLYGVSPWITFGTGLLIGAWLNNSINWNNRNVYYHGWQGGGWVGRARPYVNTRNNHYVNNKWTNNPVRVDRGINNRNIQPYRNQVRQNVGTYRPPTGTGTRPGARPNVPTTRPSQPGGIGAGATRPNMPRVPTVRPSVPGARPGTPGVRPSYPTNRPSTPGVRPSYPTTRPGASGYRPSRPATRPSGGYQRGGAGGGRPSGRPSGGGGGRRGGGGGGRRGR